MLIPHNTELLTVACRFVPYDQWLVTHVSPSWRTKQVKEWLLSKCISTANPPDVEQPPRYRPVSPITFASTKSDEEVTYPLEHELDEEDDDLDILDVAVPNVRKYRNRQQEYFRHALKSSIPSTADESQPNLSHSIEQYSSSHYNLISFSTGQVLEDDFTLSWYKLRPYELLEMHDLSSDMRISREIMLDYIQPYFEAKVKALRLVRKDEGSHGQESSGGRPRPGRAGKSKTTENELEKEKERRRRRTKLEWRDRWVVIRQGVLNLCKDRTVSNPNAFQLDNLSAIRGPEEVKKIPSVTVSVSDGRHVLCVGFDSQYSSTPKEKPKGHYVLDSTIFSLPGSPVEGNFSSPSGDELGTGDADHEKDDDFGDDHEVGRGEWIVMDMLDDNAFSSILRILHRASPPTCPAFVPLSQYATPISQPSSPIFPSAFQISNFTSASSFPFPQDITPYPEWRMNLVNRAQMAGMGEVGIAMRWVLWGDETVLVRDANGEGVSLKGDGQTGKTRKRSKDEGLDEDGYGSSKEDFFDSDAGNDADTDATEDDVNASEAEWEGWIHDLQRQKRIKDLYQSNEQNQSSISQSQLHQMVTKKDYDTRRPFDPRGITSSPLPLSSPSSPDSLRPQPDSYSPIRPRAVTISPRSSSQALERRNSGMMRDGGIFVPRPSSPFMLDEPFSSMRSGMGVPRMPGSTVTSVVSVGVTPRMPERSRERMPERPRERKPRPRSATVTASVVGSKYLKRDKGKNAEQDQGTMDNQNQVAVKEKEEKDTDKREKSGSKLKKSDQRRPQLSLTFSQPTPIPPSLPTPTASNFVEPSRTPTVERPRLSFVRHVRSGSSLRIGFSRNEDEKGDLEDPTLEYECDVVRRVSHRKKRNGLGIVRGVSERAERLMKGFDSALDFVDGR